ncbi:MAG: DMT family transporter [Deltaproteobacteria bacterium]|nr:DMT family transporter [Deltaproteobacteria bacterium]
MRRHVPAHPYILLGLATLFWSGNFVLGRAVSDRIPPIGMAFWRWAGALAILLALSFPRLRKEWPVLRSAWKTLLPLGLLGVGSFNTLVYVGLHETTATNAVLLNSACPAFILAISFAGGAQTASRRQTAGIAVSLLGVLTIVGRGSPSSLLSLSFNRGDVWVLAAVLCWAVYTVLLKRRPQGIDPMTFLCALVAIGVACLAPLYAWEIARGGRMTADPATFGSLLYLALLPSVASYVFWNQAVGEVGPNRAGAFLHLMPAFGSMLAVGLLGESFRPFHLAGIALILSGVTLAGRR